MRSFGDDGEPCPEIEANLKDTFNRNRKPENGDEFQEVSSVAESCSQFKDGEKHIYLYFYLWF